jgi:amino acid transporter
MFWKQLFARKSLEMLDAEAKGENRLRRILGPVGLTSLGIGAIIGAGIFVMTGRAAAQDAGPAIMLSYVVAGIGCLFAALCYAEFAAMAPVAGSAYTYAYATLGEVFAWIIGWDLILEYAMACACVASSWSKYFNYFLQACFGNDWRVPDYLISDPFTHSGAWFNLPAALITLAVTVILVIGIRESATTNAILVGVKIGVVLFVIGAGIGYVNWDNWTRIPPAERILPGEASVGKAVEKVIPDKERAKTIAPMVLAAYKVQEAEKEIQHAPTPQAKQRAEEEFGPVVQRYRPQLPRSEEDKALVAQILPAVQKISEENAAEKWGLLGEIGLNKTLEKVDDAVRSPFMPYGLAGIIFGASIVFFAYIGFDSISTHSEEAVRPARDVPIGILASLVICTALYIGVAAVITGMVPYYKIDPNTAVASAFSQKAQAGGGKMLHAAGVLIATGGLAGMTSVLLITFLSQARIFLAMARDGLMPMSIFGAIHEKFRTPHRSTILTGVTIAIVSALTPITKLEEMVNIGTLMAFVIVCAAVLLLRIRRPEANRPFRTPVLWLVAPLGILVNLIMMLFLPVETWLRLVIWLVVGMVLYFSFGYRFSLIGQSLRGLIPAFPGVSVDGHAPTTGAPQPAALKKPDTDFHR